LPRVHRRGARDIPGEEGADVGVWLPSVRRSAVVVVCVDLGRDVFVSVTPGIGGMLVNVCAFGAHVSRGVGSAIAEGRGWIVAASRDTYQDPRADEEG